MLILHIEGVVSCAHDIVSSLVDYLVCSEERLLEGSTLLASKMVQFQHPQHRGCHTVAPVPVQARAASWHVQSSCNIPVSSRIRSVSISCAPPPAVSLWFSIRSCIVS